MGVLFLRVVSEADALGFSSPTRLRLKVPFLVPVPSLSKGKTWSSHIPSPTLWTLYSLRAVWTLMFYDFWVSTLALWRLIYWKQAYGLICRNFALITALPVQLSLLYVNKLLSGVPMPQVWVHRSGTQIQKQITDTAETIPETYWLSSRWLKDNCAFREF